MELESLKLKFHIEIDSLKLDLLHSRCQRLFGWSFFYHSISVTHHSSLITHHCKIPCLFGTIIHFSSLNIFHIICGPHTCHSMQLFFFFFFSVPKLTEPSEKKKKRKKRTEQPTQEKKGKKKVKKQSKVTAMYCLWVLYVYLITILRDFLKNNYKT